jgi:hypothetical protein
LIKSRRVPLEMPSPAGEMIGFFSDIGIGFKGMSRYRFLFLTIKISYSIEMF